MADESKKLTVALKDIIRELQDLQEGNKSLLTEYHKAGDELADAVKQGDEETAKYLKEFRQQAKAELEKTVSQKLGGAKLDSNQLSTALAALPHIGKIQKQQPELPYGAIDTPAAEHRMHSENAAAGPKPSDNAKLTPKTFADSMSKVLTSFLGTAAAVRDRYRKGNVLGQNTFRALSALPSKIGDVLERLPLIQGLSNFIKGFVNTVGAALATVGALVSLSGFLKGWDKAKEWFGENADFWDKLSSGLAAIAQTFLGLDEDSAKELAMKISNGIHAITNFIKGVFTDTVEVIKVAWSNVDKFIGGFRALWDGIVNLNFAKVLDGLQSIGEVIIDVAKAVWDNKLALVPILYFFSGPILAAATAIAGVVGGIASVLGGTILAAFTGLLGVIGTGLTAVLGPVAVAVAAIAAGLLVFKAGWDGIQAGVDEYRKTGNILGAIRKGITAFGESIVGTVQWVWDGITGALKSVTSTIVDGFTTVKDAIVNTATYIYEGMAHIFNSITSLVSSIAKETFDNIGKVIKTAGTFIFDAFNGAFNHLVSAVSFVVKGIFEIAVGVKNLLAAAFNGILDGAKYLGSVVSDIATSIVDFIAPVFSNISNTFESLIKPVLPILQAAVAGVAGGLAILTSAFDAVVTGVDEYRKSGSLISSIKKGFDAFGTALNTTLTGIWDGLIEGLAVVVDAIPFAKGLAERIRASKIGDSSVQPVPSSNATGAQEAADENRRLLLRSQAAQAQSAPIVIQQQSTQNNSNTTQVNPLQTRSGGSFAYL